MVSHNDRLREIQKYSGIPGKQIGAYNFKNYCMAAPRQVALKELLLQTPIHERRGYLDVSCGRGEGLALASVMRYWPVRGTEAVDFLLDSTSKVKAILPDLPYGDNLFDTVVCFDVMEHIPFDDWEASINSMARVCSRRLILCISNTEDHVGPQLGTTLHITRLAYGVIDGLLSKWLPEYRVQWLDKMGTEDAQFWDCVLA